MCSYLHAIVERCIMIFSCFKNLLRDIELVSHAFVCSQFYFPLSLLFKSILDCAYVSIRSRRLTRSIFKFRLGTRAERWRGQGEGTSLQRSRPLHMSEIVAGFSRFMCSCLIGRPCDQLVEYQRKTALWGIFSPVPHLRSGADTDEIVVLTSLQAFR